MQVVDEGKVKAQMESQVLKQRAAKMEAKLAFLRRYTQAAQKLNQKVPPAHSH